MPLLPQPELHDSFAPYVLLRQHVGLVPQIFQAQSLLPRLIDAEVQVALAILTAPGALTRIQKEILSLSVALRERSAYWIPAHSRALRELGVPAGQIDQLGRNYRAAGLPEPDVALVDLALKVAGARGRLGKAHIDALLGQGLNDGQLLEAILTTALARFQCTLALALDVDADFDPAPVPDVGEYAEPAVSDSATAPLVPYLRAVEGDARDFPAFAFFEEKFGFVPNIFRAQTLRPDVLEAEACVVESVLLAEDVLSRVQKEYILLAISAANLNTYCVAVHCEMLRALGVPEDASDQIAVDHHHSGLSAADKALLDFALGVARGSRCGPADVDRLRLHGFDDRHVLEAIAMASLTNFLNTLQVGLGAVPDFRPRRDFARTNPPAGNAHHTEDRSTAGSAQSADPDAELVAIAMRGDAEGFEQLVRRHHRRVYRAALCVTGNQEDAEDAAQVAFVKAFQNLGTFEHHARFTTWLTRIAINEALARVRMRRPMENLSLEDEKRQEFRPALGGAWVDDPEQLYAREELRVLIERAMAEMPVRYRMAVLLRDVEQLSTNEAASALGLPVPTLKKHLMRGRLMLREALAPHFLSGHGTVARV